MKGKKNRSRNENINFRRVVQVVLSDDLSDCKKNRNSFEVHKKYELKQVN